MATESTTSGTAGTSAANTDGQQVKIEFTPEQQIKIQEIVDRAVGKVSGRLTKDLETAQTRATELETALASAREAAPPPTAGKGSELEGQLAETKRVLGTKDAEVQRLQNLVNQEKQRADQAAAEVTNVKKNAEILQAIGGIGFIDNAIDMVVNTTAQRIQWSEDHNKFVVMGPQGTPELNNSLEPKSLKEYYRGYAENNKYLLRTDVVFGAGSSESKRAGMSQDGKHKLEDIFGSKSTSAGVSYGNQLALHNKPEFRRLKNLAMEQGLV